MVLKKRYSTFKCPECKQIMNQSINGKYFCINSRCNFTKFVAPNNLKQIIYAEIGVIVLTLGLINPKFYSLGILAIIPKYYYKLSGWI